MSIRYDGYILDKNYSLMELNHIMKEFRKIAVNYCEKAILEQTVYQFLYFYHFREIHSDVRIKELIEKAKDINDPLKNYGNTHWKKIGQDFIFRHIFIWHMKLMNSTDFQILWMPNLIIGVNWYFFQLRRGFWRCILEMIRLDIYSKAQNI